MTVCWGVVPGYVGMVVFMIISVLLFYGGVLWFIVIAVMVF